MRLDSHGWLPLHEEDAYQISKDYDIYNTEYKNESENELGSDTEPNGENARAGFVVTGTGSGAAVIKASKLQADGKLAVAGDAPNADSDFVLARYNTNGTLDTSFNTNGKVVSTISGSTDKVYNLQTQTDMKLVAVGYGAGSNLDFALVRYNTNGTLDTTFNTTGKLLSSIGTSNDVAYGFQIQTDGKLVAAGASTVSNSDFSLARYNTNGTLDTSFNTNGKVFTSISTSHDWIYGIQIQTDGKLVGTGAATWSTVDFALARYNTDGTLDTSFNTTGKLTTSITTSSDLSTALQIQTNGNLVAAGRGSVSSYDFALARYNTDGTLDTSFSTTGISIKTIGANSDLLYGFQIQADGKFVAGGRGTGTNYDFAIARYNTDGTLDTSFITSGKGLVSIGVADAAYSVAIQTDGAILLSGDSGISFVVSRFVTSGAIDTSFSTQGFTVVYGVASMQALKLQTDGKIVGAGYTDNGANDDFTLIRYNVNGTLDTAFNTTGTLTLSISTGTDYLYGLQIQTNGNFVALGIGTGQNLDLALVRYSTNGALDTSFNTTGKVLSSFSTSNDNFYGVQIQTDGKLVAAGNANVISVNLNFGLARYNTDGSFDTSFNTNGILISSISTGDDGILAFQIQTDGKLVGAGFATGTDRDFALARYNTDGTFDTSFNTSGKIWTSISLGTDAIYGLQIQSNGKLVVAGSGFGTDYDFALARYNTDGTLDTSFKTTGKLTSSISSGNDYIYGMEFTSNGKMVVVGYGTRTTQDLAMARYLSDGSLDTTFGTSGKYLTTVGSGATHAKAIAITKTGKYLIGGDAQQSSSPASFAVIRVLP